MNRLFIPRPRFRQFLSAWLIGFLLLTTASQADYKVRSGETLSHIALRHQTTVSKLMSVNGIRNAKDLRAGQLLRIPGSSRASSRSRQSSRSGQRPHVILDPGHGGKDKGAYWAGVRESDLNLKVARRAAAGLRKKGYRVTLTRNGDYFVSLKRRSNIANRHRDAIFISIHFNANKITSIRGGETYYAGRSGSKLAKHLHRKVIQRCRLRDRRVRFASYKVLRETRCPAALIEGGYISNPSERRRCNTSRYQARFAQAIVDGVVNYSRTR